jgi:hypothetical protein
MSKRPLWEKVWIGPTPARLENHQLARMFPDSI